MYIPANVFREDEMADVLHTIDQRFGRLDAVVNCAGQSETFVTHNFNTKQVRQLDGLDWPVKICSTLSLSSHESIYSIILQLG